jgi:conserved oligomeric Golgi complex subunit 2
MQHSPQQQAYCFNVDELSSSTFDAVTFVKKTSEHVSLEALKVDLERCHVKVEADLLALINRDYTDFVEISTNLEGMDEKLKKVTTPLENIKSRGYHLLEETKSILRKLNEALRKIEIVQREKLYLSNILKANTMLNKSELILHGNKNTKKKNGITTDTLGENNGVGETLNECLLLSRVANLLNKVVFIIYNNDDCKKSKLAGEMMQRSSSIEKEILKRLEVIFGIEITPDDYTFHNNSNNNKSSDYGNSDSNKTSNIDFNILSKCFEAYASLGVTGMNAATRLLNKTLIAPFTDDAVTQGRLDGGTRGSCNGLMSICEMLRHFIENTCLGIVFCANKAIESQRRSITTTPTNNSLDNFDFFTVGIWEPIIKSIQINLKSIFSPGIADLFHKNYKVTHLFLKDIENLFIKKKEEQVIEDDEKERLLKMFRSAKVTVTFKSKWSLSIYFQLRRREIYSSTETQLSKLTFLTTEFNDVLTQIFSKIWSKKIILSPLISKFLALHCQTFDKLMKWVNDGIDFMFLKKDNDDEKERSGDEDCNMPSTVSLCWRKAQPHDLIAFISRWNVFLKWFENDLLDDIILTNVKDSLYLQAFKDNDEKERMQKAICKIIVDSTNLAVNKGKGIYARIWELLSDYTIWKCKKNLVLVKNVVKAYRFQEHKAMPEIASAYVSKLLQPLKDVVELSGYTDSDQEDKHVDEEMKTSQHNFVRNVFKSFAGLYIAIVESIILDVEKSEASLKRLKSKSTSGSKGSPSDGDKMKMQLKLDTDFLIEDMSKFLMKINLKGLDVEGLLNSNAF